MSSINPTTTILACSLHTSSHTVKQRRPSLWMKTEYNWGNFTDKLTFRGLASGGIKVLLFNCGLLHFTLGIITHHQFGVWSLQRGTARHSAAQRARMNLAYISQFSPANLIFFAGAPLWEHTLSQMIQSPIREAACSLNYSNAKHKTLLAW